MADTFYEIPVDSMEEEDELPSKTYYLDPDNKRIIGTVDGIKAMQQAIAKAIMTPRFKCLIYDDDYGCELLPAISENGTDQDYIQAVAEGFVKDALLADSRINSVEDFEIEFKDDVAYISFTCETIFGTVKYNSAV